MADTDVSFPSADDYPELRESVAKLCADYPSAYWRALESQPPSHSYPTEFVKALTDAGYLAALIPEGPYGEQVAASFDEAVRRAGGMVARVERYGAGTESATIPAPACTWARPSAATTVRMAIARSIARPPWARYPTAPA